LSLINVGVAKLSPAGVPGKKAGGQSRVLAVSRQAAEACVYRAVIAETLFG
jgi:hypothetical protein